MNRIGIVLVLLVLLTGIAFAIASSKTSASAELQIPKADAAAIESNGHGIGLVTAFENLYNEFMQKSLPGALDKYYSGSIPETISGQWVRDMFAMAGAFDGIVVNLQEGDMANASANYNEFAVLYNNISDRVPEWKGYFNTTAVDMLGKDLAANNTPASFQDIGAIGATCSKCHGDNQPQVWAKYYWRNFQTVNVSTTHGNMTWGDSMDALAGTYAGVGVNAAKGNQSAANDSFNQFRDLYTDVKVACSNCHDTPRFYYVSDDVFATIDQMGQNITDGNMNNAIALQQSLGVQCYRCHVLHMPAQDMKNKMEK
ncbi:Uncharacterised protein [uncultured archaeon]|nr:Uncharacterised protein [uncultured archaeon]